VSRTQRSTPAATVIGGVIAAAIAGLCGPARATAGPDASPGVERSNAVLDEIVVTARRREERLRDVPVAMSVLSGAEVERSRIEDLNDLQYAVPSLTVTPFPGSPLRASIGMRGQAEADLFPTLDPAVGVYLDGVYIARSGGANLDLVDIERVEVLRGPQGTLFGRNTIGGAINLVPVRPQPEADAEFLLGGGNYDRRDYRAVVNLPMASGALAARIVAWHAEHGGYGRNVYLGQDLNEDDTDFFRAQLAAHAGRWEVNLAFDRTETSAGRNLLTMKAVFPPLTTIPAMAGHPDDDLHNYEDATARDVYSNRFGTSNAVAWGASAAVTFESEAFRLRLISAYRELDNRNDDADLDGSPYDLFTVLERDEQQHQVSHELQAFGDALEERLHWIGGLHYFEESTDYTQRVAGVVPATLTLLEIVPAGTARNDSVAAFAELNYAITQQLRVTAGVRYARDGRQLTSRNAIGRGGTDICTLDPRLRDTPDVCEATLPERNFEYLPWTLGLDLRPSDELLLYAKVSQGFRAGGYNMRGTTETDLATFEPERITAFEIGARAALSQRRFWFDVALFRSLYDDIQLRQQVAIPNNPVTLRLTQNGGEARISGAEFQLSALAGPLRLTGTLGLVDARYTKLDPQVENVTLDSQFLQTPETTASIAADWSLAVGATEFLLHADYGWRSDEAYAYEPETLAIQEAYGLLNASITTQLGGSGQIEVALWARNILDQRYIVRAVDMGSLVTAIPGDPRTIGISLAYRLRAKAGTAPGEP
jgi:iron complex outermembrane receptor protein